MSEGLDGALPVYLVYYKAPDWLCSAVESLLASAEAIHVTVIDNSGDAPALDPRVRVVDSGGNVGFTGGANLALRDWLEGDAEFCVIGSHDLHVTPDTLGLMRKALADDPGIGIAGPALAHGSEMPEPMEVIDNVVWVSGTCMMLRRQCIEEIGVFDERYRSYAEDFDLGYRATRNGWRVAVVRSAVARGLGTAHGGQASRRLANSVLFDRKFYGRRGGVKTLGRILAQVPGSLLARRPKEAAARIAAVPLGLKHLVTYKERSAGAMHPEASRRTPGLEVVVVAYGSPDMLRNALEPVRGFPVTVVDNSSMREIADLCEEIGCRYIDPGRNGGFAAGVNVGLAHRSVPGGDVLLLNPDAVIPAHAVRELQSALRATDDVASVGPRQVDGAGNPVRVAWPFASPAGIWLDALGLSRLRPRGGYVSGAILLMRAEAIDQVGEMDESFFLYYEEADWAYRASRAGWRHAVVDSVTALHEGGAMSSDETKRQAHFHASQERFLRKHYGALGWNIARVGQVLGDLTRSALRRNDNEAALRARAELYVRGPLKVESLYREQEPGRGRGMA